MTRILRFIQMFALGTWVGSIIFLSFVVTPALFALLANRDQAGDVVGFALTRLHLLGMIAAIAYLIAGFWLSGSPRVLCRPGSLAIVAMLALTIVSQQVVRPRMTRLRTEMGSIEATPAESPLRAKFDSLHAAAVRLEGAVLLLGIAAIYFTVREQTI